MKTAIMKKWVRALRSGKFKQGMGKLRREMDGEVRYCCLGVLCELHRTLTQTKCNWKRNSRYGTGDRRESGVLPKVVMKWAGLPSDNPGLLHHRVLRSAGTLNDTACPFSDIADAIEKRQQAGKLGAEK